MTLKVKYMAAAALMLGAVLALYTSRTLDLYEEQIRAGDLEKNLLVADLVRNQIETSMLSGRKDEVRDFVTGMRTDDIRSVELFSPEGVLLASTPGDSTQGAESLVTHELPILRKQSCTGCHADGGDIMAMLKVSISGTRSGQRIDDLRTKAMAYFSAAMALVLLAIYFLTRTLITDPLGMILRTIQHIKSGETGARARLSSYDEIGSVGRSLDEMLDELGRTRKKLEEYHLQSMQQVERVSTMGELASAIAHEIKNPLAGISGAMQVFAEDFPGDDPRREIIDEVQREIGRLDKAVRDLLGFARPQEPYFIVAPLDELVRRAVRLIRGHAKKRNIDVTIDADADGIMVHVDPDQINQVFVNIMMNAMHSMPNGGGITVSISRQDEPSAVVSFADSGHGIAAADMGRIFKPFYTTKKEGTGLGLAVCRNIVEKHGGKIDVTSTLGQGTEFRVTLPLRYPEEQD